MCIQAQQIQFQRAFGNYVNSEQGSAIQQTTDSGYLVWGTSLLKLDVRGTLKWKKAFPILRYNGCNSMEKGINGGYFFCGIKPPVGFPNYKDVLVVKTNENGDTLWTKLITTSYDYGTYSIKKTFDNNYIIGAAIPENSAITYAGLIKINENGDTLWTKTYDRCVALAAAIQTTDSGYLLACTKWFMIDSVTSTTDFFLIKTDANGDTLWTRKINTGPGTGTIATFTDIKQTTDNGFILSGSKVPYGFIIKTDTAGNVMWNKTVVTGWINSVALTSDGGYIITGTDNPSNQHAILTKTNGLGVTQWVKTYGGSYTETGYAVIQANDGGYVFTGSTSNLSPLHNDYLYVVKTDSTGYSCRPVLYTGPAITRTICYGESYTLGNQTFTQANTYTNVPITNGQGCDTFRILSLSVRPALNIPVNRSGNILFTDTFATYQWLYNGQLIAGAQSRSVVADSIGEYKVVVSNTNGCSDTSAPYTYYNCPPVYTDTTVTLCYGDSIFFHGTVYSTTGVYTYTVQMPFGCDSIYRLQLSVSPQLVPSLTVSPGYLTTGTFTGYQWYLNGDTIVGATSNRIALNSRGIYTVGVYNIAECPTISEPYNYPALCQDSFFLYPDTLTEHNWLGRYSITASGPYEVNWIWGDGDTSVGLIASHIYNTPGYYNICMVLWDATGCLDIYCDSATYIYKNEETPITVWMGPQPTDITETIETTFQLVPNPAHDILTIKIDKTESGNNYLTIYDIYYNLLKVFDLNNSKKVDISNLPKGTYIAELRNNERGRLERKLWIKM
jgi:hypothetical protein